MASQDPYAQWAKDAELLAEVGGHLFHQPTRVQVRLPRSIAAAAVAAWERDGEAGVPGPESHTQRTVRHQAGTIALIGLSIQNGGVDDGDDVVVDMPSWYVGLALEAADEAGLLSGPALPQN